MAQEIQLGQIKPNQNAHHFIKNDALGWLSAWRGNRKAGSPCKPRTTCFSSGSPLKYPVGVVLTPRESGPGMLGFGVQTSASPRPGARMDARGWGYTPDLTQNKTKQNKNPKSKKPILIYFETITITGCPGLAL